MENIPVERGETTDSLHQFFVEGKFGESWVVADWRKIKEKLRDREKLGRYIGLGYAKSHPESTSRILSPKNHVILSRDVILSGRKKSCDNKSADNDLVDKGNESDDSYADMPLLVPCSESGIGDSSADSDHQTEPDEDNSNDDGSVFSSSNSKDKFGYDSDGY